MWGVSQAGCVWEAGERSRGRRRPAATGRMQDEHDSPRRVPLGVPALRGCGRATSASAAGRGMHHGRHAAALLRRPAYRRRRRRRPSRGHPLVPRRAGCGPLAFARTRRTATLLKSGRVGRLLPAGNAQSAARNGGTPVSDHRGLCTPTSSGTLFIALAGLMNVAVMLDAGFRRPKDA